MLGFAQHDVQPFLLPLVTGFSAGAFTADTAVPPGKCISSVARLCQPWVRRPYLNSTAQKLAGPRGGAVSREGVKAARATRSGEGVNPAEEDGVTKFESGSTPGPRLVCPAWGRARGSPAGPGGSRL